MINHKDGAAPAAQQPATTTASRENAQPSSLPAQDGAYEGVTLSYQEALEKAQLRERVIESVTNGIVIIDASLPDQPIVYCNEAFERITGYTRSEVLGWNRRFLEGTTTDDQAKQRILAAIEAAESCQVVIKNYRKDRSSFWNELTLSPLFDANGQLTHYVGVQADVTSRVEAEDQLAQKTNDLERANEALREKQAHLVHSEKMASLGQLAAGVAHEINNPIAFMLSNLGMLSQYADTFVALLKAYTAYEQAVQADDADAQQSYQAEIAMLRDGEDLDFIMDDVCLLIAESLTGGERVKEIVQSLKSFARLDEAETKEADINEGIKATLRMVWNELKYTCTVKEQLGSLPAIRCYPGQLNQVFMNLIMNAAQAMPDQGEITIETKADEQHIIVRVSDTGIGIPEAHLDQLFNPFFTTKPVGEGTGLGLSISYGIIRKHGGRIEVESQEGHGTTFTILLPIQQSEGHEGDHS